MYFWSSLFLPLFFGCLSFCSAFASRFLVLGGAVSHLGGAVLLSCLPCFVDIALLEDLGGGGSLDKGGTVDMIENVDDLVGRGVGVFLGGAVLLALGGGVKLGILNASVWPLRD